VGLVGSNQGQLQESQGGGGEEEGESTKRPPQWGG